MGEQMGKMLFPQETMDRLINTLKYAESKLTKVPSKIARHGASEGQNNEKKRPKETVRYMSKNMGSK